MSTKLAVGILSLCISCAPHLRGADAHPSVSGEKIAEVMREMNVEGILKDFAAGTKGFPDCGQYVIRLDGDGSMEQAGVTLGSVIVSRAGYLHPGTLKKPLESKAGTPDSQAGELVWVTPANERRVGVVPQGALGYSWRPFRSMPNWYLRRGQRNPKWDRQVITALLQQDKDARLAEFCWAAAIKAGYQPDRLSRWCGMMLALANQDYPRAEGFATEFGQPQPVDQAGDFPVHAADWQQLAFLTGNPQWLLRVAGVFPIVAGGTDAGNARSQVELSKQVPAGTPAPSVLAKGMKRTSFIRNADTSASVWAETSGSSLALYQAAVAADPENPVFPDCVVAPPLEQYNDLWFSPAKPTSNLDVEIHFRGEGQPLQGNQPSDFARCVVFGLADRDHHSLARIIIPNDAKVLLAQLSFGMNDEGDSRSWMVHYAGTARKPQAEVWRGASPLPGSLKVEGRPPFPSGPNQIHVLRVVRVNGQAEALLNGRRLALAHVPEELRNVGLFMRVVGCRITVTSLRADVLE